MLNNGTVGGGSYSFKKLELCISVAPAIDAVCLLMELFDFLNVFFSSFFFFFLHCSTITAFILSSSLLYSTPEEKIW